MLWEYELQLFRNAVQSPGLSKSIGSYIKLVELFFDDSRIGRNAFQDLFERYYGLRSAGLTDNWRRRYFELLYAFSDNERVNPYHDLLLELYVFPRRKGDMALQFSFVSKLVAFHDEGRPLYDKHVGDFFGLGPPHMGSPEFRISGFVANLNEIARRYQAWMKQKAFSDILDQFRDRHPAVAARHPHRLFDFLVHAAGKHRNDVEKYPSSRTGGGPDDG